MYNEKQLFAANPIGRYAIGDRDKLAFNPMARSTILYPPCSHPGKTRKQTGCRRPQVAHSR